jgi:hypothetical protein
MARAVIPLVLVHDHGCTAKIEKLMVEHGIDITREFKSHVDPETNAWVIEQEEAHG